MDAPFRLKIQVHGNSFEAEGDRETVQEQFRAFQEMISNTPAPAIPPQIQQAEQPTNGAPAIPKVVPMPVNDEALNKIMEVKGRVIKLTVHPPTAEEAILLMMYGQKALRQNELCSGGDLLHGLDATGGYPVQRVDRVLHNMGIAGDIIVTGEHRGKKYRLRTEGLAKARQLASEFLANIA